MHRLTVAPFLKRFWRNEHGVALIEMAIAFPIVLWFVIGILELAIVYHISSLMNYAAQKAARLSKTGLDYVQPGGDPALREAEIRQMINETITTTLGPWVRNENDQSNLTISYKSYGSFENYNAGVVGVDGRGTGGEIVIFTPVLHWKYLTPAFGNIVGSPTLDISARVLVKNERF